MGDLSENFSSAEFACRCGCGFDQVNGRLLEVLEAARSTLFGRRMVLLSGCRCQDHNRSSGGSRLSQHVGFHWDEVRQDFVPGECCAADILVESTLHRYYLVMALLMAGATGIGVAKSFVHADVGNPRFPEIVRPALWNY